MQINPNLAKYPFKGPAHPMIFKVADIAFDIAENYRYKEDNPDLTLLKQAIQNYVSGDWGPTYWILTVMNGQYTKMESQLFV